MAKGDDKMANFIVNYHVNGQVITQIHESETAEEVRDTIVIKESQWIKNSKGHLVYISFDKIDTITIAPQARATVTGFR